MPNLALHLARNPNYPRKKTFGNITPTPPEVKKFRTVPDESGVNQEFDRIIGGFSIDMMSYDWESPKGRVSQQFITAEDLADFYEKNRKRKRPHKGQGGKPKSGKSRHKKGRNQPRLEQQSQPV